MLANAKPVPSAPASRSVREFIAVLARHNVPYGELDCLPLLLRELHLNKHLAMHFWAAVASLTDKQAADPKSVTASIVEASTGRSVSEVRGAGSKYAAFVDRLERLLAGQDIAAEELPGLELQVSTPADTTDPAPLETGKEDVLPIRRQQESHGTRGIRRTQAEDKLLTRLSDVSESRRLVILPEPQPAAAKLHASSSPAPLSSYAESQPRRWMAPALIGLGVLIAAGAIMIARNGGIGSTAAAGMADRLGSSASAGYNSAIAAWKGEPSARPAPIVNGTVSSPAGPVTSLPASIPALTVSAPAPAKVSRSNSAAPPTVSPTAPKLKSSAETLTPSQKMAATAAYNEQRDANGAFAGDAPAVPVSEAAMNAQLLVSRVPVVPERLRTSGNAGIVRLQANINREGTVSHLRVLDGPADLQRPALEAVSAWRYRPYIMNGQPVSVSTTITVDFSSFN